MGFDCCDTRGPKVRTILVQGKPVAIQGLDIICAEVKNRKLTSREEIERELLKKVKEKNFVPKGVEKDYVQALLEEYERRERGKS